MKANIQRERAPRGRAGEVEKTTNIKFNIRLVEAVLTARRHCD